MDGKMEVLKNAVVCVNDAKHSYKKVLENTRSKITTVQFMIESGRFPVSESIDGVLEQFKSLKAQERVLVNNLSGLSLVQSEIKSSDYLNLVGKVRSSAVSNAYSMNGTYF
jgi:hypothetical protein